MGKISFKALIPDDTYVLQEYPELMVATNPTKTGFDIVDPDGGYLNHIQVHGHDLAYKNGFLVKGTITRVEFLDGDDLPYLTMTKLNIKADGNLDLANINPTTQFEFFTAGSDMVTGSTESDTLVAFGGTNTIKGLDGDDTLVSSGRDTLTGGLGSDIFAFAPQYVIANNRSVRVTDFDAVGGGADQDYVYFDQAEIGTPRIYADHRNTVLDFGQNYTVTLVGVDRGDFSVAEDFKTPWIFDH
jgi:Ca2+-binding RTX toxin-like protein